NAPRRDSVGAGSLPPAPASRSTSRATRSREASRSPDRSRSSLPLPDDRPARREPAAVPLRTGKGGSLRTVSFPFYLRPGDAPKPLEIRARVSTPAFYHASILSV